MSRALPIHASRKPSWVLNHNNTLVAGYDTDLSSFRQRQPSTATRSSKGATRNSSLVEPQSSKDGIAQLSASQISHSTTLPHIQPLDDGCNQLDWNAPWEMQHNLHTDEPVGLTQEYDEDFPGFEQSLMVEGTIPVSAYHAMDIQEASRDSGEFILPTMLGNQMVDRQQYSTSKHSTQLYEIQRNHLPVSGANSLPNRSTMTSVNVPDNEFTEDQTNMLEGLYKNCPRPSKLMKRELAYGIHLPRYRVKKWFQRRRAQARLSHEPGPEETDSQDDSDASNDSEFAPDYCNSALQATQEAFSHNSTLPSLDMSMLSESVQSFINGRSLAGSYSYAESFQNSYPSLQMPQFMPPPPRSQSSNDTRNTSTSSPFNTNSSPELSASMRRNQSLAMLRRRKRTSDPADIEEIIAGRRTGAKRQRQNPPMVTSAPKSTPVTTTKYLACPYAKYDPQTYSECNANGSQYRYRRCSSCVLQNIARVKLHLYRVHRRPEHYCASCFVDFPTRDDLDAHTRARSCKLVPCPFEEKMTSDQMMKIKRRKMGKDEIESWYEMYQILFPGAAKPSNPYSGKEDIERDESFVEFFVREAPDKISAMIMNEVANLDVMNNKDLQVTRERIGMNIRGSLPAVVDRLVKEFQQEEPDLNLIKSSQ